MPLPTRTQQLGLLILLALVMGWKFAEGRWKEIRI